MNEPLDCPSERWSEGFYFSAEKLSVRLLFKVRSSELMECGQLHLLVVKIRQLQIISWAHFLSWRNSEPSAVGGNVWQTNVQSSPDTVRKVLSAFCHSSSDVCGSSSTRQRLMDGLNGHNRKTSYTTSSSVWFQVSSSFISVVVNSVGSFVQFSFQPKMRSKFQIR